MFAMRRRLQQRPNRISPGKHKGPFTRKILLDVSVRQMCTCRVTLPYNLAISLCVILCHLTSPVQLRLERIWRRQAAAPAAAEGDVARHRPRLRVDDLVPAEGTRAGLGYKSTFSKKSTVWGGSMLKRFCKMFSESSTGRWAVL